MGDSSPRKRALEAASSAAYTAAMLDPNLHLKEVTELPSQVSLELVLKNYPLCTPVQKAQYLQQLMGIFGPRFEHAQAKVSISLAIHGASTTQMACSACSDLDQLLALAEVFNTNLERITNKHYLDPAFGALTKNILHLISVCISTAGPGDDNSSECNIIWLRVLRRYMQGTRVPTSSHLETKAQCAAPDLGLPQSPMSIYVILANLLDLWIPAVKAARYAAIDVELDENGNVQADSDLSNFANLPPMTKQYQALAELVRCVDAAAEGMTHPGESLSGTKPCLVALVIKIDRLLDLAAHPAVDFEVILAVMQALGTLLGHTQNYHDVPDVIQLTDSQINTIFAMSWRLIEYFTTPPADPALPGFYPPIFASVAANVFVVCSQIIKHQKHGGGGDNLPLIIGTDTDGTRTPSMIPFKGLVMAAVQLIDPANKRWDSSSADKQVVVIRVCLEFLYDVARITPPLSPASPRVELSNQLLILPTFCQSLQAILREKRAYKKTLGGDVTDPLNRDSVVIQALKLLEQLSLASTVSAEAVATAFSSDLVRLVAGQEVRDEALRAIEHCQRSSNDRCLVKFLDANLLDVLFLSLCSLHRHVDKLEYFIAIHTFNGPTPRTFNVDWDYLGYATHLIYRLLAGGDPVAFGAVMAGASSPEAVAKKKAHESVSKRIGLLQAHHIDQIRTVVLLLCEEIKKGRVQDEIVTVFEECTGELGLILDMAAKSSSDFVKEAASKLSSEMPEMTQAAWDEFDEQSPTGTGMDQDGQAGGANMQQLLLVPQWMLGRKSSIEPTYIKRPVTKRAIERVLDNLHHSSFTLKTTANDDIINDQQLQDYLDNCNRRTAVPEIYAVPLNQMLLQRSTAMAAVTPVGKLQERGAAVNDLKAHMLKVGLTFNQKLIAAFHEQFQLEGHGVDALTVDQFTKVIQKADHNITGELCTMLFKVFDTDGSGALSLKEVVVGMSMLMDESEDVRIRAIFKAYDEDESGTLERDELKTLCKAMIGDDTVAEATVNAAMATYKTEHLTVENFLDAVKSGRLNLGTLLRKADELRSHFKATTGGGGGGGGGGGQGYQGKKQHQQGQGGYKNNYNKALQNAALARGAQYGNQGHKLGKGKGRHGGGQGNY